MTLSRVLPDRGLGRFGLTPRQQNPRNAFVALEELQRVLDRRGRANALFVGRKGDAEAGPAAFLRQALALEGTA